MSYDRMQAKKVKGEHCRFCGDAKVALVKTVCCEQWICCDTKALSFRGGGFCQVQHERLTLCHFHHIEGHSGRFEDCEACKNLFSPREYEEYLSNSYPRYPEPLQLHKSDAAFFRALKNL